MADMYYFQRCVTWFVECMILGLFAQPVDSVLGRYDTFFKARKFRLFECGREERMGTPFISSHLYLTVRKKHWRLGGIYFTEHARIE